MSMATPWRLQLTAFVIAVLFVKSSSSSSWSSLSSSSLSSSSSSGIQHLIVGGGEQEFLMDSEIHRRFLAAKPYYISYGSLAADRVPCPPMSGKSYYNPKCNRGGAANPYKRGCSTITKCRRDVS